jgi:hypothetical protein
MRNYIIEFSVFIMIKILILKLFDLELVGNNHDVFEYFLVNSSQSEYLGLR